MAGLHGVGLVMNRIRTSPAEIISWLGFGALCRSDNLRMPGPEKATQARVLWEVVESGKIATVNATDSSNGGDDG